MEATPYLSIVITTYNRALMVRDAIDSAMEMLKGLRVGEIIVVDDCSTDNTIIELQSQYSGQLLESRIRLVSLPQNLGVTGAKNAGVRHSQGEWVLFLDSDDVLIPEMAPNLFQSLYEAPQNCPIVFFRCCDERGWTIGPPQDRPFSLSIQKYLREGTPGECPPVIRRNFFLENLYDEDLRGFEGLAYYRLISKVGPAIVSPLKIRRYRTGHEVRLSSKGGIEARALYLCKGNLRLLKLAHRNLSKKMTFLLVIKALYYLFVSIRVLIKNILGTSALKRM